MRTPVIAVLATSLVLAACGGGSDGDGADSAAAPPAVEQEAEAPSDASSAAPGDDRIVPTASGGTVDLDAIVGQDVLLWFWAPW